MDALIIFAHAEIPSDQYQATARACVKLKIGNLPEYRSEGIIENRRGVEMCVESYGLHKAPNGDWWADRVEIYNYGDAGTPNMQLIDQNLGPNPFSWVTSVETNATIPIDTWQTCEQRIPDYACKPPSIFLSANGVNTTGGNPIITLLPKNSQITFNMSASDPNGNYECTRLWVRTNSEQDWEEIHYSIATSSTFTYSLGTAPNYYFKCRSKDDTEIDSVSAFMTVQTAPF